MKIILYIVSCVFAFASAYAHDECTQVKHQSKRSKKITVHIILGSTRQERSSEKIAQLLKKKTDLKPEVSAEIIDLRDYALPFFNDSVAPASRKEITDPQVKKWSDKISQADAFIFIVPEYNAGYPGVLKNALDSLYKEWNNKPVGFVGYSGGPSGGKSAIAQLHTVAQALKMIPIGCDVFIPTAWKALGTKGDFADKTIEQEFTTLINQLITKVR